MDSKNTQIDGISFTILPLQGLKALRLDKKVVSMLLPAFKAIKNVDTEINLGELFGALSESLDKLSESDLEKFLLDMFSTTTAIPQGQAPTQLDQNGIDKVFVKNPLAIYKLVWEVAKFNNFTPFALMGGGLEIIKTLFSENPLQKREVLMKK